MVELDENIGDILCIIGDREIEIGHDLAHEVLELSVELRQIAEVTADVDALCVGLLTLLTL
jgi:hypothetical protein